jgi:uncharacterized protein
MMHPDTDLRLVHPSIGLGVVATKRIPLGTITWVRDPLDQVITAAVLASYPGRIQPHVARWCFVDGRGETLLCWDHGRFVNHSCDPNCSSAGFDFEMAIRDIEPGEQLTDDYGRLRAAADFACLCGSPRCRRVIHPDGGDLARYGAEWAAEARAALAFLAEVPQALWELVPSEEREALGREVQGGEGGEMEKRRSLPNA